MAISPPPPSIIIPWITTPLESGPLSVNHYTYAIDSLSASTQYEYRAYMVVDGLPYYGNTCIISTLSLSAQVPTVNTGNDSLVTQNSMRIVGSSIVDKGIPSSIIEYGVIYSQSSSTNLIYGGVGVNKKSIFGDINIGEEFFIDGLHDLSPLINNTMTYYRAFGKNSTGIGYGEINSQQTLF